MLITALNIAQVELLGSTAPTPPLTYSATYTLRQYIGLSDQTTLLTGTLSTEPVTIVPLPDTASYRNVLEGLFVYNPSASTVTVTVRYKSTDAVPVYHIIARIDLPAECTLSYEQQTGFKVTTKSGGLTLDKSFVGLGNVDNTSDASKPVSTATAAALALKQDALSRTILADAAFLGTIAWTGTAPQGPSNHRISVHRLDRTVTFCITLDYAVASVTATNFTITGLTQLPDPQLNSNFNAALDYVALLEGRIMTTGKTTGTANISPVLRRNSTNTAFEITCAPAFNSGGYRFVIIKGTYMTGA